MNKRRKTIDFEEMKTSRADSWRYYSNLAKHLRAKYDVDSYINNDFADGVAYAISVIINELRDSYLGILTDQMLIDVGIAVDLCLFQKIYLDEFSELETIPDAEIFGKEESIYDEDGE